MSQEIDIYVATTSFLAGGLQVTVGDTIAAGHPVLKGREQFFAPFEPTFDHRRERAAADARNDAKKQAAADARAAERAAQKSAADDAVKTVADDAAAPTADTGASHE